MAGIDDGTVIGDDQTSKCGSNSAIEVRQDRRVLVLKMLRCSNFSEIGRVMAMAGENRWRWEDDIASVQWDWPYQLIERDLLDLQQADAEKSFRFLRNCTLNFSFNSLVPVAVGDFVPRMGNASKDSIPLAGILEPHRSRHNDSLVSAQKTVSSGDDPTAIDDSTTTAMTQLSPRSILESNRYHPRKLSEVSIVSADNELRLIIGCDGSNGGD